MAERPEVDELRLVACCHGVDGLDHLRYWDSLFARDSGVLDREPAAARVPEGKDRKVGLVETPRGRSDTGDGGTDHRGGIALLVARVDDGVPPGHQVVNPRAMVGRRCLFRASLTMEEDDEPLGLPRRPEQIGAGGRVRALDERPGHGRALGVRATAAARHDEERDEREGDPEGLHSGAGRGVELLEQRVRRVPVGRLGIRRQLERREVIGPERAVRAGEVELDIRPREARRSQALQ